MKKTLFIWLLMITTMQITVAQTTTITGSVQDEKGSPLHYVFVADDQSQDAVYSDSLGNFTISVHPDSKLKFGLPGYRDTLVNFDQKAASLQVVLRSGSAGGPSGSVSTKSTVSDALDIERPTENGIADLPGHKKGNVHGNRYLLDDFVHGYLINTSDVLVHNPNYRFDYDKLGGVLLISKGDKSIIETSADQTKTFVLYSNTDERFVFERVLAIDNAHYVQVLASGKNYKIYKLIKTKFVRADYVNNGVTSHGNDYDEYLDDADYYVFDVQANQLKKISLKKKSIKDAFAKEADKVNKFISDNSGDINDAYLSKLGDYMNK
ncbi:MAG TPA: hypothetical protein VK671_09850 [Mucilaginibacter sp.]|nr:hypothetical protein [Mucilaginibacter sp.]